MGRLIFFCCVISLTACDYGNVPPNIHHTILSQSISINNAQLKNCTFHPNSRIVHFPMFHYPVSGKYDELSFDQTAKSQFQLLQTIISYRTKISVFDEHITGDKFNTNFVNNLRKGLSLGNYIRNDGTSFQYLERYRTAFALFGNGIPRYYEHLTQQQKIYLFDMGASFTLLFLGLIPKIHQVISSQDYRFAKSNFIDPATGRPNINRQESQYWIFDFREQKLKEEVLKFYRRAPAGNLILIAYGADHDFRDEFQGYPFQAGNFCLNWLSPSFQLNPS